MADRKRFYEGRRAVKFEGGSFKAEAYPEGITEADFLAQGLKNGTFAKQAGGDEAKQRQLLGGLYAHLFGKKGSYQETMQADAGQKAGGLDETE